MHQITETRSRTQVALASALVWHACFRWGTPDYVSETTIQRRAKFLFIAFVGSCGGIGESSSNLIEQNLRIIGLS